MVAVVEPVRWDVLLLGARAAFLVVSFGIAAVAFIRWRRACERDAAHTAGQLASIAGRLAEIEDALARCEPRLQSLTEQAGVPPTQTTASAASANYQVAIRLARSGASAEELMSSCGLSRQEADLVARLHGPQRRPRKSAAVA